MNRHEAWPSKLRRHLWDDDWSSWCDACRWEGPRRPSEAEARADLLAHAAEIARHDAAAEAD